METSRTSTTDTIGQRRIDNLPINGRNYINFTLTDSQVVRDNAPSIGAAPTSGLNMSGQRARSNLVNVDGADATDNSTNGVRSTVSQEAVQEFQIITNNYSAEYGRAAGGVVNIITRSGSNDFHGDVFGLFAQPEFSSGESVQHRSKSRLHPGAGGRGFRRSDQERQDVLLLFLRNYTPARDGILQHRPGQFRTMIPFDTTAIGLPFGTLQLTGDQISISYKPATCSRRKMDPAGSARKWQLCAVLGASSGQAVQGFWPTRLVRAQPAD